MISLNFFRKLIKTIKFIIFLTGFLIIINFFYNSYLFYQHHYTLTSHLLDLKFILNNNEALKDVAILYLNTLIKTLCIHIVVVSIVYYLFNRIPIPNAFFRIWHQQKEIQPVLGKQLVHYFKWNVFLNIKDFLQCSYEADVEQYHINLHYNGKNLHDLFKSFDKDVETDHIKE